MKNSTTVVMLVIFGVVLGIYGLAQWKQLPTRDERRENAQRIFPDTAEIENDEIDRVQLESGEETLVFERRGKLWQMIEPIDVLAEPGSIDSIVREVKDLEMKTSGLVRVEDGGLNEYGLEKPTTTVTLFRGDEAVATLLKGDKLAINDSLTYVKTPDEEEYVFVVENSSINSLDKSRNELRERDLITTGRFDADYVHLAWADRQMTAEKREGAWQLITPVEDRADESKVQDLISDAGKVRVEDDEDFVDDKVTDLTKYGLDAPELTIEVRKPADEDSNDDEQKGEQEPAKPVVERVLIGKPVEDDESKRYAMLEGEGYVVTVSAEAVAKLDQQTDDLRSRDLAKMSSSNVDFVRIERPAGGVVFAKKDFNWRIYQPDAAAGDSTAIGDFIEKLSKLQIEEFLDDAEPSEYGLDAPQLTVSVWEDSVTETEVDREADDSETQDDVEPTPAGKPIQIRFGKHDEEAGRLYAQRGEAKGVVAVSDEILETLNAGALAFRDKKIFDFTASDVARLDLVRDDANFTLEKEEEKEDETEGSSDPFAIDLGNWRMTAPVEAPANSNVVRDLASSLLNLRTPRYLAEKPEDLAEFGLEDPSLRVTITMKAEEEVQAEQGVLLLGSAIEETADSSEFYGMLSGGNLIFAVERRIADLLGDELRDPEVFSFATADVEGITLTFPDRTWSLSKQKVEGADEEQWTFEGEAPFELDTAKVESLLSSLGSLATERFVQYQGGPSEGQGFAAPAATITIALGDEGEKTLTLGATADEQRRLAATPDLDGAVFVVEATPFGQLADDPNYLRAEEPEKEDSDSETPSDSASEKTDVEPAPSNDKPSEEGPSPDSSEVYSPSDTPEVDSQPKP